MQMGISIAHISDFFLRAAWVAEFQTMRLGWLEPALFQQAGYSARANTL